jgi:hypothetical protein
MRFRLPEGYRPYVRHFRRVMNDRGFTMLVDFPVEGDEVLHHGGGTIVDIYDEHRNVVATGASECSKTDRFTKKIGYDIAMGRALKELAETDERARVHWTDDFLVDVLSDTQT